MMRAGVNVLMQSFVIRRLKVSVKVLVAIGVPLTIASFVCMWLAGGVWGVVAALMLNGFGQSFVNPAITTALSLSVGASGQGRLAGLSTSTQALAFLLGPITGALLYGMGSAVPFVVGCSMTIVALGLMLAVRQQTPDRGTTPPARPARAPASCW